MRRARHRDVETLLVVDRRQRDFVEAVDVDDEIERLADRQEVGEDERLLRLLVAFVRHAERDERACLEELVLPQIVEQMLDADLAEPHADRAAEDPDDELVVASVDRKVVRRDESEIVRGNSRSVAPWLSQFGRDVERYARSVARSEVRIEDVRGELPG